MFSSFLEQAYAAVVIGTIAGAAMVALSMAALVVALRGLSGFLSRLQYALPQPSSHSRHIRESQSPSAHPLTPSSSFVAESDWMPRKGPGECC